MPTTTTMTSTPAPVTPSTFFPSTKTKPHTDIYTLIAHSPISPTISERRRSSRCRYSSISASCCRPFSFWGTWSVCSFHLFAVCIITLFGVLLLLPSAAVPATLHLFRHCLSIFSLFGVPGRRFCRSVPLSQAMNDFLPAPFPPFALPYPIVAFYSLFIIPYRVLLTRVAPPVIWEPSFLVLLPSFSLTSLPIFPIIRSSSHVIPQS
ncbi:hypothetical protein DL93DRAFT_1154591 [Clavulina sp. PMI_390]|nr:hypothetical protein DL93DRAFT_1154591 [Clavulina sp. PMI_390]